MSRKFLKPFVKSIRRRLLLWLLVPLIVLCCLSTFVAYKLAKTFANKSHDEILLNSAGSIASRLRRNAQGILVADIPEAAQAILRQSGKDDFYYQIVDSKARRLGGDSILPLPRYMNLRGPQFRYAEIDGKQIRICRIPVQIAPSNSEIWVQCAKTLNSRKWLQNEIFVSIVTPQMLLVVLASFSVWVGIRNGLAPLRILGASLRKRSKLDFSPVRIKDTPEELEPLTDALNTLFLRAENQIALQRQFVANAAHQLRTPVTAMKTYIDYAERAADERSLVGVLQQMSEATDRVVHTTNKLLILARSEGNSQKSAVEINLADPIIAAGKNLVHEALKRKVALDFEIPEEPVFVKGDLGDLEELVSNLIDNAIKYSSKSSNGAVWVKVIPGVQPILQVEDNGCGISDNNKEKVFERFYRIPGTTATGCGLGLSIVSEIATRHGARVKVLDRPEGGTVFEVVFPRFES